MSESAPKGEPDPAQVHDLPEFGADAPAAGAATEDLPSPSQEKTVPAEQKTVTPTRGSKEAGAAAPRPAPKIDVVRDADGDAVRLFARIVNVQFVNNNRFHLQSWAEQYTPKFIELAWSLARSGKSGANVPVVGLVWLLQGTKPWPDELVAQYERDCQATQQPTSEAGPRVQKGDLLRWADGHTATVERLDRAFIVTDSENDDRGYVAFAQLGKGVEVLRS